MHLKCPPSGLSFCLFQGGGFVVVDSLFNVAAFSICFLFGYAILCVLSLDGEERAGCFTSIVIQISFDYYFSVALPHGAVGWYAVCNCGIF